MTWVFTLSAGTPPGSDATAHWSPLQVCLQEHLHAARFLLHGVEHVTHRVYHLHHVTLALGQQLKHKRETFLDNADSKCNVFWTAGNVSQLCSSTCENPSRQIPKIVSDGPDMWKAPSSPGCCLFTCVCVCVCCKTHDNHGSAWTGHLVKKPARIHLLNRMATTRNLKKNTKKSELYMTTTRELATCSYWI